jgi:hypothetical protein
LPDLKEVPVARAQANTRLLRYLMDEMPLNQLSKLGLLASSVHRTVYSPPLQFINFSKQVMDFIPCNRTKLVYKLISFISSIS